MVTVTIGVDLGQQHDPTAIAVTELDWPGPRPDDDDAAPRAPQEDHYLARHLERLPLGTPYPAVAARVAAVVQGVRQRARLARPGIGVDLTLTTYMDATGVGAPVMDLLRAAGIPATPVYFMHGDRLTQEAGRVTLGKAYLVSRLQVLLQTQRIHLPNTDEARALARELQDYEIRIDEQANDRYGAFKVGTHDDLVTALGLSLFAGPGGDVTPAVLEALANW